MFLYGFLILNLIDEKKVMNLFKNTSKTHGPLQQNPLHQFPMNYGNL
jgi:hypothetical protein